MDKNKLKILIVDDNPDLRKFTIFCLENDYHLIEAANGADAYDIAVRQMPDLIISDIMMPVMNGIELCEKIKTDIRTSHIPLILLTAYDSEEKNLKGYKSGADDYISKPFNTEILLARITNLVSIREKLAEKYSGTIQSASDFKNVENLDDKFLQKAIKIVESNLSNPEFNVEMLSKELGMSRTNLFRKMKALTNNTAVEFIRLIKMKHAAQFLLKGYNISETMFEVAISSRSYFNKCFTHYHGRSPSDFIASHKI